MKYETWHDTPDIWHVTHDMRHVCFLPFPSVFVRLGINIQNSVLIFTGHSGQCDVTDSELLSWRSLAISQVDKVILTVCGERKKYDKNNSDLIARARASKTVISQQLVGCNVSFVCVCVCLSVCFCDNDKCYRVVCCWCHSIKATLIFSFSLFLYVDVNPLMLLCKCQYVDVTLLILLCWCNSVDKNICGWAIFRLEEMNNASTNMTKTTQPILSATSTWSLNTCIIWTAGSDNNGRHYRVVWVSMLLSAHVERFSVSRMRNIWKNLDCPM